MADRNTQQGRSQGVLGDRDFLIFASGHGVSAFGDAVNQTALPLLVLYITGSGMRMGVVAMLQALPMLVFGFLAGVLADRWDRRRTMLWCDIGRAILIAGIPISVLVDAPTMNVLYAVVMPIGTLWVLFGATSLASVPALVGRERLAEANAYLSAATSIGYVVGPSIAGLFAALVGATYTLGIDALTFVFSATCWAVIRRPLQIERAPAKTSLLAGIREGMAFIFRHRVLRAVLLYYAAVNFVTAPLVVCVTFYITKDLAMSDRALGSVVSAYAIGATLGALLGTRVSSKLAGYAMLIGTVDGGLALIVLANIDQLWIALVIALLAGAGSAMATVFHITLRAQFTPDHLLGRVISTARVVTFGPQPLSLLLAGVLLDLVGGATTLWILGGASLTISAAFWLLGGARRTLETPPQRRLAPE